MVAVYSSMQEDGSNHELCHVCTLVTRNTVKLTHKHTLEYSHTLHNLMFNKCINRLIAAITRRRA